MSRRTIITLPDGRTVEDRRTNKRLLERLAREPVASITLFTVLGVMAWGIVTSNTRTAQDSRTAAYNAGAAKDNAQAAKDLAVKIDQAVGLLSQVGTASRKSTFDSHQAMQDTLVCILRIRPESRSEAAVDACIHALTPPPAESTSTTTTTRR